MATVNRAGLIRLTMRSDEPIARKFQDWAVKVLDTTIETGSYIMGEEKLSQPNLTMSELEQVLTRCGSGKTNGQTAFRLPARSVMRARSFPVYVGSSDGRCTPRISLVC